MKFAISVLSLFVTFSVSQAAAKFFWCGCQYQIGYGEYMCQETTSTNMSLEGYEHSCSGPGRTFVDECRKSGEGAIVFAGSCKTENQNGTESFRRYYVNTFLEEYPPSFLEESKRDCKAWGGEWQ